MSKLEARRLISSMSELDDVTLPSPLKNDRAVVSRAGKIIEGSVLDTIGNLVLCPNAAAVQLFAYDQAANYTDLYTVLPSRKAIVGSWSANNQSGSTSDTYLALKRAGVYYRISVLRTLLTVQGINDNMGNFPFVFEAGDVIAVFATNTNMNTKLAVVTFDSSSALKSIVKTGLTSGDNTVYTCPTGKRLRLAGGNGGNQWIVSINAFWPNDTGNTRTVKQYFVPSGDSVRAQNQFAQTSGSIINLTNTIVNKANTGAIFINFEAGDAWVLNLDSAPSGGQFAYITGFEYDV